MQRVLLESTAPDTVGHWHDQQGRRNRSFEAVEVLAALDDFAARARRPRYGTHSG